MADFFPTEPDNVVQVNNQNNNKVNTKINNQINNKVNNKVNTQINNKVNNKVNNNQGRVNKNSEFSYKKLKNESNKLLDNFKEISKKTKELDSDKKRLETKILNNAERMRKLLLKVYGYMVELNELVSDPEHDPQEIEKIIRRFKANRELENGFEWLFTIDNINKPINKPTSTQYSSQSTSTSQSPYKKPFKKRFKQRR